MVKPSSKVVGGRANQNATASSGVSPRTTGEQMAVQFQDEIAAAVPELEPVVLRHGHHRVRPEAERVFPEDLFRGILDRQDAVIVDGGRLPVRIDRIDQVQVVARHESSVRDLLEPAGVGAGLAREAVFFVERVMVEDADAVVGVPEDAEFFVGKDLGGILLDGGIEGLQIGGFRLRVGNGGLLAGDDACQDSHEREYRKTGAHMLK